MANNTVELILDFVDRGVRAGLSGVQTGLNHVGSTAVTAAARGGAAVDGFTRKLVSSQRSVGLLHRAVVSLAGGFSAALAVARAREAMERADAASDALTASLESVGRQFANIGSLAQWEAAIDQLSAKLKIWSKSDLKEASAAVVLLTGELGLNQSQMEQMLEATADLSAGRMNLVKGIQTVCAALAGEGEAARALGLTLTEEYVEAWYKAHNASRTAWKDLTELQQAQVRYRIFLEQAAEQQGRSAKHANTLTGALQQVRAQIDNAVTSFEQFRAAMQNLGEAISSHSEDIAGIVSAVVSWTAAAVDWVMAHRELIGTLVKVVLGIQALAMAGHALSGVIGLLRGLGTAAAALTGINLAGVATGFTRLCGVINGLAGATTAAGVAFRGFVTFAAAWGVTEIATLIKTIYEWRRAESELAASQQRGVELNQRLAETYARISQQTGVTIKSHQDLRRAIDEGKIHFDDATQTWKAGAREQIKAVQSVEKATGEALKSLQKRYQQYTQEVRQLQEQIGGRQKSLAAELREMARSGMSEKSAWYDQKREAEEYVAAAKRAASEAKAAMDAGDTITGRQKWQEAVQYADDAKNAYKGLNQEVSEGDQVIISKAEALRTAMAGVQEAGQLGIDILKQQQDAAYQAMDVLEKESGFAGLFKGLEQSEQKWLESWQKMRSASTEALRDVDREFVIFQKTAELTQQNWATAADHTRGLWIKVADDLKKKLDDATKPRTVKVYVAEVQKRALGGLIGAARLARGGKLPGFGGGDRISALLEAGEFVMRKEAVARFGTGFFDALNHLRLPDFSALLPVMPVPALAATAASGRTMNINLTLGGETWPMQTDEVTAQKIERWYALRSSNRITRSDYHR